MWFLRLSDWLRHRARERHWNPERAVGRRGEDLAQRYLQRQGYTIVSRNYSNRSGPGEIDIVARDGDTVVFVEVKTRLSAEFGAPERAIDREKEEAVWRTARDYCRRADVDPRLLRFDLVTVVAEEPPRIRHFRGSLLRSREQ